MKIPEFKREFTCLEGEDENGTYHSQTPVRIVREVEAHSEDDEDVFEVSIPSMVGTVRVDGCDLHPHPHAPATNVELITHFMEWARSGALGQAFVIESISKYAEQVITMPQDQRDQMDETMLPYAPWRAAADEALEYFARRG